MMANFPQMNSTSLFLWFQLLNPRVGPVLIPGGHHMNKIDKGPQRDTKYQISKLYDFKFQMRRILMMGFFVPMFQLVTPGMGPISTPGASYEQTW